MKGLFKGLCAPADLDTMGTDKVFDRLVHSVEEDELDLSHLENTVRREFGELGAEVAEIKKNVDNAVRKAGA